MVICTRCFSSLKIQIYCLASIFASFITMVFNGIIYIVKSHLYGYPQKYQHSSQIHCINCGYNNIQIIGKCCFQNWKQQFNCITYQACRQIENHDKQQDQKMYHFGLFLIISGIIGVLFLFFIVLKNRQKRRLLVLGRIQEIRARYVRIRQPLLYSAQNVNRSIDNEPKKQIIKQQSFIGDGQQCSICLQGYSIIRRHQIRIPCKHKFHSECLKMWHQKQIICPLCRSQ